MQKTNSTRSINLVSLLKNPSGVVPSLSENEIYTIVVDSIREYVHKNISFEIFVDIITKIKLFSGLRPRGDHGVAEAINELSDLYAYSIVKIKKEDEDMINNKLIAVLDKLSQ